MNIPMVTSLMRGRTSGCHHMRPYLSTSQTSGTQMQRFCHPYKKYSEPSPHKLNVGLTGIFPCYPIPAIREGVKKNSWIWDNSQAKGAGALNDKSPNSFGSISNQIGSKYIFCSHSSIYVHLNLFANKLQPKYICILIRAHKSYS